jgi:hypothetical protein
MFITDCMMGELFLAQHNSYTIYQRGFSFERDKMMDFHAVILEHYWASL